MTAALLPASYVSNDVAAQASHLVSTRPTLLVSRRVKIERDDTLGKGNTIRLTLYRRDDPTSPATQTADDPDVQSAYTPMIVRRDPTDRICVTGSITTTGTDTIEAQQPICN